MIEIAELFGQNVDAQPNIDWKTIVKDEFCPFTNKQCSKSCHENSNLKLGTCAVLTKHSSPLILCPQRFLHNDTVFKDCVKLMDKHEDGNEIRIIREFQIPGGQVDFVLQSLKDDKVVDFIGIEFQAISTTGTLNHKRHELLQQLNVIPTSTASSSATQKGFGINWKHISKTILTQTNHKIHTFEKLGKKLVLVTQDALFEYFQKEFNFAHLASPHNTKHSMHYLVYKVIDKNGEYNMELSQHHSTTADGVSKSLNYVNDAFVNLDVMIQNMEKKNFSVLTI